MLSDEVLQSISPVPLLRVSGDQVAQTWEEQRRRPGVVPVLLGNREATSIVVSEARRAGGSVAEVVQESEALDLNGWMEERRLRKPEDFDVAAVDRPWDGVHRTIAPFVPAYDHRGAPLPELFFALIPAEEPWLVPAHLRTAGVGDLPRAAVQTALARRWYERHGAAVTTIADGAIEFQVEEPLISLEEAHQLAIEQFFYCPDIVHQGFGSIGNLANILTTNRVWYCWWAIG